jgi:hypothetical protein
MVVDADTFNVFYGGPTWPTAPGLTKTCDAWTYNIVVAERPPPPSYVGTFTTRPIALPEDMKWDMVNLDGNLPANTTLRISVLDDNGNAIAGYTDIADWNVDLSRLHRTVHDTIQIKVTISSIVGNPTPVLERLTVKWLSIREWRDEFYGDVRIERLADLGVSEGRLVSTYPARAGQELVFASFVGTDGFTTSPKAFFDAGGQDYVTNQPHDFGTKGTYEVEVADVNDDGYTDMAFAVLSPPGWVFIGKSPLFLGSPVGPRDEPFHTFNTTGAADMLLRDLDEDGYVDVVFAQQRRSLNDFQINSTLFWGSADGWADAPDLELTTTGASGVEAVDVDGDGMLDLVFACFKDFTTSTDSMVFLQDENGYCGTVPSHLLPTNGAMAVDSGDLDGDDLVDLVFANMLRGGSVEIDSFIYWGKAGGGFEATPSGLPTSGANDVEVADLDGDGHLDIVFADQVNNSGSEAIGSSVFLNNGRGAFGSIPYVRLPTLGAMGVAVADLDGTGWMDLVFANTYDGTSFDVPSFIYLGGDSGWGAIPTAYVPTEGATDVVAVDLLEAGSGAYMSEAITVEDRRDTGTFHTFRYNATLSRGHQGVIQIVDADTWEVLAETRMVPGHNEWALTGEFLVREHPSVRVVALVSGLDGIGFFSLDDLWLNWTKRVREPPTRSMSPTTTTPRTTWR